MKFLADEDFPGPSVQVLRDAGLDVMSVAEDASGANDHEVIELARKTGRVLLACDSDHSQLVFAAGVSPPPAIIYFRLGRLRPAAAGSRLLGLLKQLRTETGSSEIDGHIVVIEPGDAVRMRPFRMAPGN